MGQTPGPLHLLFSWQPKYRRDTIEAHQAVGAAGDGTVWWGRFNLKQSTRRPPGAAHIDRLTAQVEAGIPTWAFFRHTGPAAGLTLAGRTEWAARLVEVTAAPLDVDPSL